MATSLPVSPPKPMLRWSSVKTCPRMAVFAATGAPHQERSRTEEGYLLRGKNIGRDFAVLLASTEQGKGNPYRIYVASGDPDEWPAKWTTEDRNEAAFVVEEPLRWSLGVMHPDVYVVETKTIVEILSSLHADAQLHGKLLQLTGQLEHHPEAESGAVVVVNPSNLLDYEVFPVSKKTASYQDLRDEMRARIAAVQEWSETGALPARVCSKPADARSHLCLHGAHCFEGYEAPPLNLVEDEEAQALASRFYDVKQRERVVKEQLGTVESERKEIEQRLIDLVPAGKHQVGSFELSRTHVIRKPTVDLKKAELAGVPLEGLSDFMKPGSEYDTWRVDRIQGEDFGEVPF